MDELTEYLMNNAEDGFWGQIQSEARRETDREPALVSFLFTSVLRHSKLEDALCVILANKLQTPELSAILLRDLCNEALAGDGSICASIRADLLAARTRDPAAHGYLHPLSVLQGFSSSSGIPCRALAVGPGPFGVDVHPAARIGAGVLIDHGTSVVIGETAVVEDNVSILHEVTLGGTGNQSGDRHPKVRRGVLLGAGAKILGNIEVGRRLCLNSLTRHLLSNFEKIRLAPRPGLTGTRSSALPAAAGESGRHIRCAPVISTLLPDTPTKDRFCESRCSRPHTRHTLSPGAWGRRSPPSPAKPPP